MGARLKRFRLRFAASVAALGLAAALGIGLWPVPTPQARADFLTDLVMSEEQERQVAEQEHPKILSQFGGAYDNPKLAGYVQSIATYLGQVSDRPDIRYRVTILNSPVVNAFALPAGYLYVTRGLLAIASSEAELAGVIGHEIGHVTARHTAQRYSRTLLAAGLVEILGALTKDTQYAGLNELATPLALIALQSYSREHEYEADVIGVRNVSRAGYDPQGMPSFLAKLEAHTKFQAAMMGREGQAEQFDLLATHPRTADRVQRTIQEAAGVRVYRPMVGRDKYLRLIDGLLYGDDPAQGFVRDRVFAHPELNFRFEVPPDFHLLNGTDAILAQGPEGALIRFDLAEIERGMPLERYLVETWGKEQRLAELQLFTVNEFSAATAVTRIANNNQAIDARLVAIEAGPESVYRFMFVTEPELTQRLSADFRRTTFSFRRMTEAERGALKTRHLRVVQTRPGDTVDSLARSLPYKDRPVDRLINLNGFKRGQPLPPYQLIKTVVE